MSRLLAFLPVPALLLAAATAATVPKSPATPEYFPTTVGDRWVVRVTVVEQAKPKRDSEHTEVVTAVEEKDGVKLVTVARDGGRPVSRYAVSPGGVSRVSHDGFAFNPPLQLLRLPSRPGDEWEWDSAVTSPFPPAGSRGGAERSRLSGSRCLRGGTWRCEWRLSSPTGPRTTRRCAGTAGSAW